MFTNDGTVIICGLVPIATELMESVTRGTKLLDSATVVTGHEVENKLIVSVFFVARFR